MRDETDADATTLRVRAFLDGRVTPVLVALLAVVALGGALTYTAHVDPGTEQRERTVGTWSVGTTYDHSAVVTEPTSLFANGTELTDRQTYFRRVAPELDGTAVTTYEARRAENVTVSMTSRLVVRGTVEGEDGSTEGTGDSGKGRRVLWSQTEPLGDVQATGVEPGEPVSLSFTVNASAVAQRLERVDRELGAVPGEEEAVVETDVVVSGVIDGEPVQYTRTAVLDVAVQSDAYTVTERGTGREPIDRTEIARVEREYGPLRTVGGPLSLVAGLALAAGLVVAGRRDAIGLDGDERRRLAFLDDRAEFDAWISRIRLPEAAFDRPAARAESLADLVDYAIDNDTGVVEDPETGVYHVLADDYRFTFEPPGTDASAAVGGTPTPDDGDPSFSPSASVVANGDGSAAAAGSPDRRMDGSDQGEADAENGRDD